VNEDELLSNQEISDIARDAVALVLAAERKDLVAYTTILASYPSNDDLTYLTVMLSKFVISSINDFLEVSGAEFSTEQVLQALALQMASGEAEAA
jgi:hypothetical protein